MLVVQLGRMNYVDALRLQTTLSDGKIRGFRPDVLLSVEHPATITLGRRGLRSDVLISPEEAERLGIEIHTTDRGGLATYHGPGQLVCYPIMDLRARSMTVTVYVHALESVILCALERLGLNGMRIRGKPGIWVSPTAKIASIGVNIRRRVTSHGFSLNVKLAHDPSKFIVNCGMADIRMTDIASQAGPVEMTEVTRHVVTSFGHVFDEPVIPMRLEELLDHEILRDPPHTNRL
jgi:lipoate-protein ligase B